RRLYDKPSNSFVAGFIGSPPMNQIRVSVTTGGVSLGGTEIPLDARSLAQLTTHTPEHGEVLLGLRPEALEMDTVGIPMIVDLVEELGSEALCHGRVLRDGNASDPVVASLVIRLDARLPPATGSVVQLRIRDGECHFFATDTGHR